MVFNRLKVVWNRDKVYFVEIHSADIVLKLKSTVTGH